MIDSDELSPDWRRSSPSPPRRRRRESERGGRETVSSLEPPVDYNRPGPSTFLPPTSSPLAGTSSLRGQTTQLDPSPLIGRGRLPRRQQYRVPSDMHHKSSKSSHKRHTPSTDLGLALLDTNEDYLDPTVEARIAELSKRVQNINPSSLPPPPPSSDHSHATPPPPTKRLELPEVPPRVPLLHSHSSGSQHSRARENASSTPPFPSPSPSPSPSPYLASPHVPPHAPRKRLISSMLGDVKDKLKGKDKVSPSLEKATHPPDHLPHHERDAWQALRLMQAEQRILSIREQLHRSTLDRAQSAKEQLAQRYALIYEALNTGHPLPNPLSVARWRRKILEQKERQTRLAFSKGRPGQVTNDTSSTPISEQLPNVARINAALGSITEVPESYVAEATSLQWLPHLASLQSRFSTLAAPRKDLKDWHLTAAVVDDYVRRGGKTMDEDSATNSTSATMPRSSNTPSTPESKSHKPLSKDFASGEQNTANTNTFNHASPRSSLEHTEPSPLGAASSQRSGSRGFRLSLSGFPDIFDMPRHARSGLFGPNSPPLVNPTDLSPSSSKHNLGYFRKPLGDEESTDMSFSESEADPAPYRTPGNEHLSASEEETRIRQMTPLRASSPNYPSAVRPTASRTSSRRWRGPLFARRGGPGDSDVASAQQSKAPSVMVTGLGDPPPLDLAAINADLAVFPRVASDATDKREQRAREQEEAQRLRGLYDQRIGLLKDIRARNARLSQANNASLSQITAYAEARTLMNSILNRTEDAALPSDLLSSLLCAPLYQRVPKGPLSVDAAVAQAEHHRRVIRQFLAAADASRVSWLTEVQIPDPTSALGSVLKGVEALEEEWRIVQGKLDELRQMQDEVDASLQRLHPAFRAAADKIDTTYPELGRNADLTRQLIATGQPTLPYISSLPPWAREVLGPTLEYTLEFFAFFVRFCLYPISRILPSPIRTVINFVVTLIAASLLFVVSMLISYWKWSVHFGESLSRFFVFRVIARVLRTIARWSKHQVRKHARYLAGLVLLAFLWYLTTPPPLPVLEEELVGAT